MAEGDAQRKVLTYCTEALGIYFQDRPDVYVAGNLFIYYEEGNPNSVVAPDAFVIFGVSNQERRSYKTWEEGNKTPDFVLEITSKTTRVQDQGAKKGIYAFLGVAEYFQYDPTGDYLSPRLQGFHLSEGNYFPIAPTALSDGFLSIHSEVLGLDLRVNSDGQFRFYNPVTGSKLMTHREAEQARLSAESRIAELEAKLQEQQATEQVQGEP